MWPKVDFIPSSKVPWPSLCRDANDDLNTSTYLQMCFAMLIHSFYTRSADVTHNLGLHNVVASSLVCMFRLDTS